MFGMRVAVVCLCVLGLMMTLGCGSESSDTVFPVTGVISAYSLTTNLMLPQAGITATGTIPVNAKISDEKNLCIKIGGVQVGPAATDGQSPRAKLFQAPLPICIRLRC